MNIALDTNAYSDLVRGSQEIANVVAGATRIVVPFIVLGELRAGFSVGSKRLENEKVLDAFLKKPRVEVLFADQDTIHHYAGVFQQLRKRGKMIPDNDLWIAAIVIQHGLSLRSGDSHFDHLPQIPRV